MDDAQLIEAMARAIWEARHAKGDVCKEQATAALAVIREAGRLRDEAR